MLGREPSHSADLVAPLTQQSASSTLKARPAKLHHAAATVDREDNRAPGKHFNKIICLTFQQRLDNPIIKSAARSTRVCFACPPTAARRQTLSDFRERARSRLGPQRLRAIVRKRMDAAPLLHHAAQRLPALRQGPPEIRSARTLLARRGDTLCCHSVSVAQHAHRDTARSRGR